MEEMPTYKFALRAGLDDARFIPTKATEKATGWDVRAALDGTRSIVLRPFDSAKIPLGIRGFCPEGWWYKLVPRSSTFAKKNLHCLYGTVDEDYEGQLIFACQYIPPVSYLGGIESWENYCKNNALIIEFGDALGQIIPEKRHNAEMLQVTNEELDACFAARQATRGTGGFGSTGK